MERLISNLYHIHRGSHEALPQFLTSLQTRPPKASIPFKLAKEMCKLAGNDLDSEGEAR
jgi:hypothetical protein